jgi:hypothetical protein
MRNPTQSLAFSSARCDVSAWCRGFALLQSANSEEVAHAGEADRGEPGHDVGHGDGGLLDDAFD